MNASADAPAIEFCSLRRSFGRTEVLRGVSTEVPANSVFGFLGPNGAGKSTTMKTLMGLLRPTSGTARVLGFDVESESLEVRRRVGYLPQSPAYPSHLTVTGVLELAARLRGVDDRTSALLELVGLTDRADRRVRGLSGGEAQRLGLAQALVGDPDVLILDEPSAGLDPAGRHEVLGLLDELRTRATIFYSTHLLDDVARLSDTIAVLVHGEIVADGPIDQFTIGDSSSTWQVRLDGPNAADAFDTLARQPWVASVEPAGSGAATVATTDRDAAEHGLLPVLHGTGAHVSELRPTRRSLEDIYFALTDGTNGTDDTHEGGSMADRPRATAFAGAGTLAMVELRRWLPKRALLLAVASLPILLFVTFTIGNDADTPFGEVLGVALIGWSIVVVLIVVGTSQGVLADAVEDGSAAWTVSMPVTRKAYVVAKFVGAAPAIALGAVIVPGLVAYPFLAASADAKSDFNAGDVINALGRDSSSYATLPSLGEYAIMLALIALLAVYLLAMMLLFGSRLTSAAALLGLGLASAAVLIVFNGLGIVEGTPGVAFVAVLPNRLEELAVVPAVIASAAWSVFAVALAAWSFDRRPL